MRQHHASLRGKQRKRPTNACHDRDTQKGVEKRKRSEDRNSEPGRGRHIEVRIVRPERLDAAAQRHQQEPTQHKSTERAISQPLAHKQVDHRTDETGEETTEDDKADRASDHRLVTANLKSPRRTKAA